MGIQKEVFVVFVREGGDCKDRLQDAFRSLEGAKAECERNMKKRPFIREYKAIAEHHPIGQWSREEIK